MPDAFVERLATDLADVYRRPRWKFWKRPVTQQDTLIAIQQALVGDVQPIRRYGISVPVGAPRVRVFNRIMEQISRLRGKF